MLKAPGAHVALSFARLPKQAIHSGKTKNLDIDSLKTRYAGEHRNHDSRTHEGPVCGGMSGGKGGFVGGWDFGRVDGGIVARMRLGRLGQTDRGVTALVPQTASRMVPPVSSNPY